MCLHDQYVAIEEIASVRLKSQTPLLNDCLPRRFSLFILITDIVIAKCKNLSGRLE